jgi:hypothetical protein
MRISLCSRQVWFLQVTVTSLQSPVLYRVESMFAEVLACGCSLDFLRDWVSLRRLNFIFSIILGDRSGGGLSEAMFMPLNGRRLLIWTVTPHKDSPRRNTGKRS